MFLPAGIACSSSRVTGRTGAGGLFEGYRDGLAARHPEWTPPRLHRATAKYVSPDDVAPHSTGGAVDLALCTADGVELDLGTAMDASPEDSAKPASPTPPGGRPTSRHRRILVAALGGAGLVNYPTEWWHWSFGDRYWALITGAPRARYGPVDLAAARSMPVPAER